MHARQTAEEQQHVFRWSIAAVVNIPAGHDADRQCRNRALFCGAREDQICAITGGCSVCTPVWAGVSMLIVLIMLSSMLNIIIIIMLNMLSIMYSA